MFLPMFSPVHHRPVCVFVCVFVCINAGMPDCPASEQSDTGLKTLTVPDQAKAVWHFLVRYQTEIIDAGMPMPALVSSMPMPSYAE